MGTVAEKLNYLKATKTAIKDAIVSKGVAVEDDATFRSYADSINAITTGGGGADLPEEAFLISGDCSNRFANGSWDWFVENYGDGVTTQGITDADDMFYNTKLETIPFELNGGNNECSMNRMFGEATYLKAIPKMNNFKVSATLDMFNGCRHLRYIPEDIGDWFDWSYVEKQTSAYSINASKMFKSCFSLRKVPMSMLRHGNPQSNYSYSNLYGTFSNCYSVDELVDIPIVYVDTAMTSNIFNSTFSNCCRVKNITFEMPNGQPHTVKWKSQVIDCLSQIGWIIGDYIPTYNAGITSDKQVVDNATYQALKDDPDWYTQKAEYSRYNHDSAVATINSLPDTSAYLSSAGGTNTIKFKGDAGSATDGGAINTLTEAEIAVATAKGWTVTLV